MHTASTGTPARPSPAAAPRKHLAQRPTRPHQDDALSHLERADACLAGALGLTQFKPTERAAVLTALTLLDRATEGIARARAALTTTSNTADGSKS